MIAFLIQRNKRKRNNDIGFIYDRFAEEDNDDAYEDNEFLEEFGGSTGGMVRSWAGGGFIGKLLGAAAAIVIMGLNAFFAAIATQVYRIFTGRWKSGGGSDIPVITTAPGGGSGAGSSVGAGASSSGNVSADFLHRYRD